MKKRLTMAGRLAAASLAVALTVPTGIASAQTEPTAPPAPTASAQPTAPSAPAASSQPTAPTAPAAASAQPATPPEPAAASVPSATPSAPAASSAPAAIPPAPAASSQPAEPTAAPVAASKLVPLRDFSEATGALVLWNDADRTATVTRWSTTISAKIGESSITVNGKQVPLNEPVQLVNEKTIVPLGALGEALGIQADWNEQTNTIVAAKDDYPLRASAFIAAWNGGRYAEARGYLNDTLRALMPDELLAQYWSSIPRLYGQLGPQLSVTTSASSVHHNATALYRTSVAAPFEITIRFDQNGGIDDLFITPAYANSGYTKPAYDDAATYSEKEVRIGEGPLALPGTLTMPAGEGPFPAVVLVHGSGPNDRDETIGSVKPFRDLAVGLAAQGIAVLRYEKITREHPIKSQGLIAPFTVNEETVDDAVRAVEALKQAEGIDPLRIYVAGHSQGGMLMPRIVEAGQDKEIAGAIILAGPSRPLEDLIVEQLNFQLELLKKAGQPTAAAEQQVAMYEQQIKLLKDPQYSLDNPPQGFLLGNPIWWLDIRNLYAAEAAAGQNVPLLIMQGGNDAQVFSDNLDGWKKALAARSDVEYKLYPKVNHTLVEFDGESTGAEYAVPANVPDYLIADIAAWIKR